MSGRYGPLMRVLIWVMPIALYAFFIFGRHWVGGSAGWMAAIALFVSPFALIVLYLPAIIGSCDREARSAHNVRLAVTCTHLAWWLCAVVVILAMPDGGDADDWMSPLMSWFGLSYSTSNTIGEVALLATGGALLATFVASVVAGNVGRRLDDPPRPAGHI